MTNRQPVHSPFEVNGGDRVEVIDDSGTRSALIDLLWRDGLIWSGRVVLVLPGSTDREGQPIAAGSDGIIHPDAYTNGCVFIHRRSTEGKQRTRSREVSRG